MVVNLPLEIISMIFKYLADDLLGGINLLRKQNVETAFGLLLVSKTVRVMLEPVLHKTVKEPSNRRIRVLCRLMNSRPELAAMVKEIDLEEGELLWDDGDTGEDEDNDEEEDDDDNNEEDREEEEEHDENENDEDFKPQMKTKTKKDSDSDILKATAESLRGKLETDGDNYQSIKQDCLRRLEYLNEYTRKWTLLLLLPNLKSLSLTAHSATFANMGMFLRLPFLEELDFTVAVLAGDTEYATKDAIPPEEILESIISSTKRLKSLTYEDGSGSCSFPVKHDASRLKEILDERAADTLEHLSIVLCNNDEKDWRMEQEFSDIDGYFGSMTNYTKLRGLSIQFEVLLGRPEYDLHLRDVLPPQLQSFTGLSLPDYHGQEDNDRIWAEKDYLQQFQELAEVAEDGKAFASLDSANMYVSRKDSFSSYRTGSYKDGILGRSRIVFGWH
ncbi:hypothetical protein BDV12DRAFT_114079 [Aspergillus spectabilis]